VYEFLRYHLISLIVVFAIIFVIFVHLKGSKKNKNIASRFQKIISPLLKKWFRRYDDELVY